MLLSSATETVYNLQIMCYTEDGQHNDKRAEQEKGPHLDNKNITIRDVAREAGVSVATVSRALNQNYPVSEKLRKRIDAAVEKLDFHPNAIARTLKTNNTNIIGFLVSDISNPFFTTILKGVEDVMQPSGYNVISGSTNGQQSTERSYLNLLMEKKVDGIIINTTGMNNAYIINISKKVPVVLSHRAIASPDFVGDLVGSDDFTGIKELTSHLLALGHRKIGLVNGSVQVSTGKDRYEGFCAAMRRADILVDQDYPYVLNLGYSDQYGYMGAKELMEREEPPTALVLSNNELALGALNYLHDHNIKVPRDVSLVAFGDIRNRGILYVRPTISSFSLMAIGNKTGEMLLERIRSANSINNREVRYMTTLVEGNSTRAL